jgi:adenosylcobinamide-phosphate synthase
MNIPISSSTLLAILAGFLLDYILGDPQNPYHPVRFLGWMNSMGVRLYNRLQPKRNLSQFLYGALMALVIVILTYLGAAGLIKLLHGLNFWLGFAAEAVLCYFIIASKCLYTESMKIHSALSREDLTGAREILSTIVGRDTKDLGQEKIAKATVETVAENLSDGVIAPLFYLFLGGVPLGFAYKAINTLDSMVGYKNDTFMYLGKFSARLDDAVNFIPARLSALLMLVSTGLLGFDFKNALKIYARDRYNHLSPNSAHTESVCAGALNIQLGGPSNYHGKLVYKPTIGDENHKAMVSDIKSANKLMIVSSALFLVIGTAIVLILHRGANNV